MQSKKLAANLSKVIQVFKHEFLEFTNLDMSEKSVMND